MFSDWLPLLVRRNDCASRRQQQHCNDDRSFSWFLENVYPENAVSECRSSTNFGQLYLAKVRVGATATGKADTCCCLLMLANAC
jgi:hypothetical protein